MDDKKFSLIKGAYDGFYRELLKSGKLPMWTTLKGFWHASSSDEVYEAFKRLKLNNFKSFIDLGSGDGKVTLIASLFCKNAEGAEADSFLHSKALEMKNRLGISNAAFHNKDFFEHELSAYDAIFISPDAPFERGVEDKILGEMKGKLIHYGHHFHPRFMKQEKSLLVNGNLVSVYGKY